MRTLCSSLFAVVTVVLMTACGGSNSSKIDKLIAEYKEVLCKSRALSQSSDLSNLSESLELTKKSTEIANELNEMKNSLSESEKRELVQKMAQASSDAMQGRCN